MEDQQPVKVTQSLFKPQKNRLHEEELERQEDLQAFLVRKIRQTKDNGEHPSNQNDAKHQQQCHFKASALTYIADKRFKGQQGIQNEYIDRQMHQQTDYNLQKFEYNQIKENSKTATKIKHNQLEATLVSSNICSL